MKIARIGLAVVLFSAVSAAPAQEATNVALGKQVTLSGSFFTCGWGSRTSAAPSSVVDGLFFPRSWQWDQGPIWWDEACSGGVPQTIRIDLGDRYVIESLVVQADDNDTYEVRYLDDAGAWALAWTVPNYDFVTRADGSLENAWGMQTRPNPFDDTARHLLPSPVETTALLVTSVHPSDWKPSVSEVQAFGHLAFTEVAIDVKPGDYPNSVQLRSGGVIPVAVLGAASFHVGDIDLASVTFAGAPIAQRRNGTLMASVEDVNGDGFEDLVLHVRTQDMVLTDPAAATLEGRTVAGRSFRGTDEIRVVPAT